MDIRTNLFLLSDEDLLEYHNSLLLIKGGRDFCIDHHMDYEYLEGESVHTLEQAIKVAEDEIQSRMKREE